MTTNTIEGMYQVLCNRPSDINEHLPVLREYASKCKHLTEMGVRTCNSTYALLSSRPHKLISYDIHKLPEVDICKQLAHNENIDFVFIEKDVLSVSIEPTDLLFIDTLHTYSQLKTELSLHSSRVARYIILHDTTTFAFNPEINRGDIPEKGLWPAVEEFLTLNPNWTIARKLTNNNGLTILANNE